MLNIYEKLDFGFFPLGSGILTDKSEIKKASIPSNGTMVLGNDFGTLNYFETKCCKTNREESSNKTIANLCNIGLDIETTFFTNFYLGLRNDKLFNGTKNTKRIKQIEQDYKEMCYNFFQVQLEMIEPKIVLCLGAEVGQTLSEFSPVFSSFSMKKNNISALFADSTTQDYIIETDDSVFGKKRFVLIPHPSYAHINWKRHDIKSKIEKALLK